MTPEMFNFHQMISELQISEDNMLDNHKQTIENTVAAIKKGEDLLRMADSVAYDQEGKNHIHVYNLFNKFDLL